MKGNMFDAAIVSDVDNSNEVDVASALRATLAQAKEQCRITCGVYESGKLLEMSPDNVMLCILPEIAAADVTLHIHFTLIEAFCLENDISLLKVDSEEKLGKLLADTKTHGLNDNDLAGGRAGRTIHTDYSCVLVEYSTEDLTEEEEDVLEFHRITCDIAPKPIIGLAV